MKKNISLLTYCFNPLHIHQLSDPEKTKNFPLFFSPLRECFPFSTEFPRKGILRHLMDGNMCTSSFIIIPLTSACRTIYRLPKTLQMERVTNREGAIGR